MHTPGSRMLYITRRAVTNGNRGRNGGGKCGASNDFVMAPPGKIIRLRLVSVSGKSVTFATRQIALLLLRLQAFHAPTWPSFQDMNMKLRVARLEMPSCMPDEVCCCPCTARRTAFSVSNAPPEWLRFLRPFYFRFNWCAPPPPIQY